MKTEGEVLEVDFFAVRGRETRILKAKVLMDVTKPLRGELKISGPSKQVVELSAKYERIGNFCNYCGHIGHEQRTCSTLLEDSVAGRVQEEKWGTWLKADQGGKRWSDDNKENTNPSQPRITSTLKQNQQRPTPVSLLKSLANLSVKDKDNNQNSSENSSTGESKRELLGVTNPKKSTAIVDDQQKDNSLADLSDGDNLDITCNGQSMEGKVGEIIGDANASFCFGQSSPPKSQGRRKIQPKQLVRRKANQGLTKSGEKRAMEIMDFDVSKKQCIEGEIEAEMGMGAYPKMAPKGI
ncbi:MAG: hypothetical protein Q8875_02730 [Pigeon pea little leaf phytoplasma]|nr:hypothetical protein [Pigeon pea little leaf phytoplasma]